MRVSRPDPEDPTGRKRRHFEISIDSPITLLDCRATQANTSLPEYSGLERPRHQNHIQRVCGCPDAAPLSAHDDSSLSTIQRGFLPSHPPPAAPQPGRRPRPFSAIEPMAGRPIHLLRRPSFNPPAFDEEEPPPPADHIDTASILTPPPRYDSIVGTPSVDGYADYFARYSARHGATTTSQTPIPETDDVAVEDDEEGVAQDEIIPDEEEDEDDDESDSDGDTTLGRVGVVSARKRLTERTGRVNVVNPRTPGGGRVPSRSLEISRPFVLSEPPSGRRA